jgi:hypothetical protein
MLSREPDLNMTISEALTFFESSTSLPSSLCNFLSALFEISSSLSFAFIVDFDAGEFGWSLLGAPPHLQFNAEFLLLLSRLADVRYLSNIAFTFGSHQ